MSVEYNHLYPFLVVSFCELESSQFLQTEAGSLYPKRDEYMIIKYRSVSDDINPKYTIKLCFAHMKNYSHNFCFVNELLKITVDDLDLI